MVVASALRPSISNSKYIAKYGGRQTARSPGACESEFLQR